MQWAWVFMLLAWPFVVAAAYFSIAIILAWTGKRFSVGGHIAFFVLQAALLAAVIVAELPGIISLFRLIPDRI
jgi:hypothetical protein